MQQIRDVDVIGQEIVVVHHQQKEIHVSRRMEKKMVKMESKVMEVMEKIRSQDKDVLDVDLDVVVAVDTQEVTEDFQVDIDVVYQNVMVPHQKVMEQLENLKENVLVMFVMEVAMDVLVIHVAEVEHLDVVEDLEEVEDQEVHQAVHVAVIIPTMSLK